MFVLWLVLPVLTIADDMLDVCWTHEVVGCELLGAALDELLMLHEGEQALTPSVLRATLRKIADRMRSTATNLTVSASDMYEVYAGAAPADAWIAGRVDFLFQLTYGQLRDCEGLLTIVALLEAAVAPRFVPGVAHREHGAYVKLGLVLQRNLPGANDRAIMYDHLDAADMAPEVAEMLRRALPQHDYVADYPTTTLSGLATVREELAAAAKGGVVVVNLSNVRQIVPHDAVLKLTNQP